MPSDNEMRKEITDECTGLYNARHLGFMLDTEVWRSERYGYEFSLLAITIEGLQAIETAIGPTALRELLAQFAIRIRSECRLIDMAFHFADGEFILLLPQTTKEKATEVARELKELLSRQVWLSVQGHNLRLNVSFGVVTLPQDGRTKVELLRSLDQKMHIVRTGRRDGTPTTVGSRHTALLARNQDLIDKFLDITERKVSVLDDYGDEHWDALPDEVKLCLKKIVQREGLIDKWNEGEDLAKAFRKPDRLRPGRAHGKGAELQFLLFRLPEEYHQMDRTLTELFRQYHDQMKAQIGGQPNLGRLSGPEFEVHIARLLISAGYDVVGTPKTGDQGADLIAKKDGKKVIIQAKRYQGPVGNKAVQEVISAVSFYGGDEGWVITNSSFTASAKALARKAGIRLIDGTALQMEQL
jgi:diguanylate cyclase (GGDEF)-like protein